MRLHDHAASANCYEVRLLLGLLAIRCDRVEVDIFAGDTLTDSYAAVNPVRETPVLQLDDGTAVTQSNAILTYLARGTSYLPAERAAQARVHQWLAFEQERVMGGIGGPRFHRITGRPGLPGRLETGRRALAVLDDRLAERCWLVATGRRSPTSPCSHTPTWRPRWRWRSRRTSAHGSRAIRGLDGFVADLAPYGANARVGEGRRPYD